MKVFNANVNKGNVYMTLSFIFSELFSVLCLIMFKSIKFQHSNLTDNVAKAANLNQLDISTIIFHI